MHQIDPEYYRTTDMISSKWSDMKRKIKKFNGIMRQKMQSRRSGASDDQVLEEAMTQYRVVQGGVFQHYACWEILKNSPVCQSVPIVCGSSKRSKTSESSSPATPSTPFSAFDLNDSDDELQMFEEDLPRPIGRDQAKSKARNKSKGKGVSTSRTEENLEAMTQEFGKFNEKAEEKMRIKALKIIMTDTSHLQEPYRTVAEEEKKRLIAKYFPQQ